MAAALRLIEGEDEQGRCWMVYEGDTAWGLCYQLSRLGVKEIALPSMTYRSGQLPKEIPDYGLGSFTADVIKASPDVKAMFRRLVRLQDCVAWLVRKMEATPA